MKFTESQLWWLDQIKDTIIQSAEFSVRISTWLRSLSGAGSMGRGGISVRVLQLLIEQLTEALAA